MHDSAGLKVSGIPAFAGMTELSGEDAVAALDPELVDEDAAAGAPGHGRRIAALR